jgi:hypothetical protein
MRLLALLVLVPSLAFGQGLSLTAPGVTGGGKVLWQAPFSVPGCYASGQTAGASSAISITRTTKGTVALTSDPSALTECASGEFRVGYSGLLVEPARTNYALQSNTITTGTAMTTGWSKDASVTVATVAGAPMGGTWAEVTNTTNTHAISQGTTTASSTTFVASAWVAAPTGTGSAGVVVVCGGDATSCACSRSDGGTCTAVDLNPTCRADVSDIGTTPVRVSIAAVCPGAITNPTIALLPGIRGTSAGTMRFGGAQLEVGTYPTSLIVTTSTATARNADAVSATVPAVPAKWCVAVTALPEEGAAWATLSAFRFWGLGTAGGNNAAFANATLFRVEDGTSADKDLATTLPATGSIRPIWCDTSGTLSVAGITQGSASGAGTGLFATAPTTLYIGQRSSGTEQFSGFLKNLKLWSAKSTREASK